MAKIHYFCKCWAILFLIAQRLLIGWRRKKTKTNILCEIKTSRKWKFLRKKQENMWKFQTGTEIDSFVNRRKVPAIYISIDASNVKQSREFNSRRTMTIGSLVNQGNKAAKYYIQVSIDLSVWSTLREIKVKVIVENQR